LNNDLGYGWNTLFFNNHDNPRMVSKIDPEGKYSQPLAKLLFFLQMTLRGTPFIYQGDETGTCNEKFNGMDEIKDVESLGLYAELIKKMSPEEAFKIIVSGTRDHARSPICWVEIERQQNIPGSVLRFYRELTALRCSLPALIYGKLEFLHKREKKLFCYKRTLGDKSYFAEVNLSAASLQSKAPKNASLILKNYSDTEISNKLHPYEARLYSVF
jgi:oligo-1,6-glucosidase